MRLIWSLQLALDAGDLGSFEIDFRTGQLSATTQHKLNYGYADHEHPTFDELKARIVKADREQVETELATAIKEHKTHDAEFRIRLKDKSVR
jgi:hypothetical protein